MNKVRLIRFSMATIMMFVLMVAAGMALFVKIQEHTDAVLPPGWKLDVPSLFLLAIVLTAAALGSWKEHTAVQIMLQVTLACVSCLTLIWIGEAQYERAIRYWCQATFAMTVTLPMLGRRFVKSGMARGPRREWWKKLCEAVFFSFLTMLLVSLGGAIQFVFFEASSAFSVMNNPASQPPAAPTPKTKRPAGGAPSAVTPSVAPEPADSVPGPDPATKTAGRDSAIPDPDNRTR